MKVLNALVSFLIINSLFSINANAQGSFFIKPKVKSKIFMSAMVDPNDFNAAKRKLLIKQGMYNPYLYSKSYQSMISKSFDLGIGLGWMSEDKSKIIELSWSADRAGFKTISVFREYMSPYNTIFEPQSERQINKISVNYNFKLKRNPPFMISRLSIGTGLFVNYNSNDFVVVKWDYNTYLEPDVKLKSIYYQPFKERKTMPFISLGVETDFFIKQAYIASLKLNIVQGFGTISTTDVVHAYEIKGETYINKIGLNSRGSGINLILSRRIQFYPWKKNRD